MTQNAIHKIVYCSNSQKIYLYVSGHALTADILMTVMKMQH